MDTDLIPSIDILSLYQHKMVAQILETAYQIWDPVANGKDWNWIWKRNLFLVLKMFIYKEFDCESLIVRLTMKRFQVKSILKQILDGYQYRLILGRGIRKESVIVSSLVFIHIISQVCVGFTACRYIWFAEMKPYVVHYGCQILLKLRCCGFMWLGGSRCELLQLVAVVLWGELAMFAKVFKKIFKKCEL